MPLQIALTPAERTEFEETLFRPHTIRARAHMLDLNHNFVADITEALDSGQVNFDTESTTLRSASVVLFDPTYELGFDRPNELGSSLGPTVLVRLWRDVWLPKAERWVEVPLFTGPVTAVSRDGDLLNVELQSKVFLSQDKLWSPITIKRGTNRATAIRTVLVACGETKWGWNAATSQKLTADASFAQDVTYWDAAKSLADSLGWVLYYNAWGHLNFGSPNSSVSFTYRTGNGGAILSTPKIQYNAASVINSVRVVGGTPKGAKAPVTATAKAPADHPLSPQNLGRGGKLRHVWSDITNDKLTTKTQAQNAANAELNKALLENVEISFDALVYPILDETDLIRVQTDDFTVNCRFNKSSVPLTSEGTASVGYLTRVTKPRRKKK